MSDERRAGMRTLLAGNGSGAMATIFDPVSARFAQALGYPAGLLAGSMASLAVLGAPDLLLISLTELAEQVRRCARASRVPLLVDADNGFGNALNVMRTVQELDAAGASAVMIEDTALPQPYDCAGRTVLLGIEESAAKMKAAVAARGSSDMLILGRTGAVADEGVGEAIARLRAYEAAGVDALFVPGLRKREELDQVSAAVGLPLVIAGVDDALIDPVYLAARRVRLYSSGHQTYSVAVQALYDAMKAVREGSLASALPGIAPRNLMDIATDAAAYRAGTDQFLGSLQ